MEAFRGRGKMDFQASHDLEDFVAVIEGRDTLLREIAESTLELRRYLAEAAKMLLAEPRFLDVLPGFVLDNERFPSYKNGLLNLYGKDKKPQISSALSRESGFGNVIWWRLHPVLEEWNLSFHFFWLAFVPSSPVAAKLCSPQYRASLQRRGTGGQCLEDCIEKILNFPLINENADHASRSRQSAYKHLRTQIFAMR